MSMFLNRPTQKIQHVYNKTRLSLHERFTYLRNNVAEASTSGNVLQRQRELQQQAARSRRIAMQMERRPAVIAALRLKKRSIGQRVGLSQNGNRVNAMGFSPTTRVGLSIKDRLTLGRRGRRIGRGMVRSLSRQSLQQSNVPHVRRSRSRARGPPGEGGGRGRLSRTQSMQSLNSVGRFTSRGRSRSRSRSRVRVNNLQTNNQNGNQRFFNRLQRGGGSMNSRVFQQKQRGRQGRGRGAFRGRSGNWDNQVRGDRRNERRGRSRGRGQRGGRRGQNTPVLTREQLDSQLDQYMANSRFSLDKDLDTYMKQASTHGGGGAMEESWD